MGSYWCMMVAWIRVFVVLVVEGGEYVLSRGIYKLIAFGGVLSISGKEEFSLLKMLPRFLAYKTINDAASHWAKGIEERLILRKKLWIQFWMYNFNCVHPHPTFISEEQLPEEVTFLN